MLFDMSPLSAAKQTHTKHPAVLEIFLTFDLAAQADVRAEIERCKGTQFDPDLADVMIAIIDDDEGFTMRENYE